ARQIELGAFPHDLLAGSARPLLRRHVHDLLEHRSRVLPRVLQSLRRLRLLEEREQLADFAQCGDRLFAHAERDALRRADEIAEHGNRMTFRLFEQQRGAVRLQYAIADLRHLEPRIDLGRDAPELAAAFELGEEIAKVSVFHGVMQGSARAHLSSRRWSWTQTAAEPHTSKNNAR